MTQVTDNKCYNCPIQDALHKELMMRSKPKSPTYMKWLTFKQVGNLTSNTKGAEIIVNFLKKSHVEVTNITPHKSYIHARASVSTWETLLQAKFFIFESRNHNNQSKSVRSYVRTHRYSLSDNLISTIFW